MQCRRKCGECFWGCLQARHAYDDAANANAPPSTALVTYASSWRLPPRGGKQPTTDTGLEPWWIISEPGRLHGPWEADMYEYSVFRTCTRTNLEDGALLWDVLKRKVSILQYHGKTLHIDPSSLRYEKLCRFLR